MIRYEGEANTGGNSGYPSGGPGGDSGYPSGGPGNSGNGQGGGNDGYPSGGPSGKSYWHLKKKKIKELTKKFIFIIKGYESGGNGNSGNNQGASGNDGYPSGGPNGNSGFGSDNGMSHWQYHKIKI